MKDAIIRFTHGTGNEFMDRNGIWCRYAEARYLLDAKDARIAELEKQLAEAKACGDNLRRFVGDYPDEIRAQEAWIKLWLPLPKEEG